MSNLSLNHELNHDVKFDLFQNTRIVAVDVNDLIEKNIPPRESIIAPWMRTQSLNMLYAPRGIGKTLVALNIAVSVASGQPFLSLWRIPQPRSVIYFDGEMASSTLQERCKASIKNAERRIEKDFLRIVTPDFQPSFMPDFATRIGQTIATDIIGDSELIVIDNLSCLVRSNGKENDAESWDSVQSWALAMRAARKSILFIHHAGKGGTQRGTSKREDVLDCVITLKKPPSYSQSEGARFEVHFEKGRDLHGVSARPFEVKLSTSADGSYIWTEKELSEKAIDKVVTLLKEGYSQKDISEKLRINKGTVSRYASSARERGLLEKDTS